jgi:integrase
MATITPREGGWRAQVRRKGHKAVSKQFRTKAAAERWARGLEDEIASGQYAPASGLTLAAAIDRYHVEHPKISRTKAGNLKALRSGPAGAVAVEALAAKEVIAHAKSRGCGPATMAMELQFLREVLEYARLAWGVKVSDPVAEARPALKRGRMVARSVERDRRPSPDELTRLRAFLAANKRMPMADLMDFAIASCMRLGEVTRILWVDFDPVKSLVLVRQRKHPVTKRDEWVPLLPEARAIVDRQPRTDERIWPYHEDSVSRAFGAACEALGIQDLRWHDFRHEGVSRLFEAGYRIEQVALVSGHKDWKSLKRYTNLKPESLTVAAPETPPR